MPARLPASLRLAILAAAFVLSGFAALVYQVSWQRILALHSGVGSYSVALIVAAFMAGLGGGSLAGGLLSARVSAPVALRLFAAIELAVGLFGLLSPWLYYDLYPRSPWIVSSPWRAGVVHFAALLLPTSAMGMTLPLLARGVVEKPERAAGRLGLLYGLNVLGASAGALITPWWLVRHFGIGGAIVAAAAANAAAAALAALAAFATPRGEPRAAAAAPPGVVQRPFPLWVALYATSGCCALALEILWFRFMDVAVKATPFTFGTLLCLYLLGYGAGSLLGAPLVRRARDPLAWFLALQCLLLAASALPYVLVEAGPWPNLDWYLDYWRGREFGFGQSRDPVAVARLYVELPALLFGLPTVLMGVAFPLLQRAVQDDPRTSGRKVGLLQAANIAGCVAGSLLVGLVSLELLGSVGTLQLLLMIGVGLALAGARLTPFAYRFAAAAAVLACSAAALPGQDRLWARLHGVAAEKGPLIGEDRTGVAALVPEHRRYRVFIGGRGHSWLPFGGIHTRLGAIPAIVHPAPLDVAVVGLGSGDTAWGAGCRTETRSLEVFEVAGPLPRLLEALVEKEARAPLDPGDPERFSGLRRFLADPRLRVRVADGRNALAASQQRYDLIQADPLRPDMALSGNLYSYEFYSLCARRLKRGGLMCAWTPSPRVVRTFRQVFPYVLRVPGDFLLGSNEPIPVDPEAWRQRAETPAVRAYLGDGIVRLVLRDLGGSRIVPRPAAFSAALNRDLFPRDEYATPQ